MKTVKLCLLLFACLLSSCRFIEDYYEVTHREFQCIKIINNSKTVIAFYPYSFLPVSGIYGQYYPDTLLPPGDIGFYSERIDPMDSYIYRTIFETKYIKERFDERDTLMFFVFSDDTLKNYSWDEIREGYKILKRYDLSIVDLDSLNWTITYP